MEFLLKHLSESMQSVLVRLCGAGSREFLRKHLSVAMQRVVCAYAVRGIAT
jgi:hypothetical protein